MPSISIKTDRKEIEIIRNGEKVGCVYFSPTDTAIFARLKDVRERLAKLEIHTPDDADADALIEEMRRIDKEIRDAIDYAFDYPCSAVVFGSGFSFSSAGGTSEAEQFLDGAIKIIEKEMKAESAKAKARQDKYLSRHKQ